ncbi:MULTISPECIES: 1-acyl-sn-glycerol-3-phosphate acyltransferase [unclassified Dysgonomonas]|uniref:1-acyl-sn-glycerol-3-phosphate acyltransferase n=1 Tax=unclassified Dysgonomonas TaxID=2630389 RepID=UPI002474C563|nr:MULTISPECIES: 1-acyl-sn-glycerol-3-phosphate acyltransferase [unclassified Dysgonomonas]
MKENNIALLDLDRILKNKAPKIYNKIPHFFINYLKRKIHQDELNEILTIYANSDGVEFMKDVTKYFNLTLNVEGLDKIPDDGRFVFASNHPLGGLDGICLSAIIGEKYNGKIKYPVNDLLLNIPNLRSIFIPINKHGGQSKAATEALSEAFGSDNQIITFPAGLCSRKQKGVIMDLEWKKNFITKAIESKRSIVPVYFKAANSNFFYRFANIRKKLGIKFNVEMVFLPDEMFKNKNKTFSVIFGQPIPYSFFDQTRSMKQWAEYMKKETYMLGQNP